MRSGINAFPQHLGRAQYQRLNDRRAVELVDKVLVRAPCCKVRAALAAIFCGKIAALVVEEPREEPNAGERRTGSTADISVSSIALSSCSDLRARCRRRSFAAAAHAVDSSRDTAPGSARNDYAAHRFRKHQSIRQPRRGPPESPAEPASPRTLMRRAVPVMLVAAMPCCIRARWCAPRYSPKNVRNHRRNM